mgnify:CR=1 FL=1
MIDLKVDEFIDGKVAFHISRQDEEDYKRLKVVPFILKLSDGKEYFLSSVYRPTYLNRKLYVRGWDRVGDSQKMIVEFTEFLKIFELLKEYNKTS